MKGRRSCTACCTCTSSPRLPHSSSRFEHCCSYQRLRRCNSSRTCRDHCTSSMRRVDNRAPSAYCERGAVIFAGSWRDNDNRRVRAACRRR